MASDLPQQVLSRRLWWTEDRAFCCVPGEALGEGGHGEREPLARGQFEDEIHKHLASKAGHKEALPCDGAYLSSGLLVWLARGLVAAQVRIDVVRQGYSRTLEADEREPLINFAHRVWQIFVVCSGKQLSRRLEGRQGNIDAFECFGRHCTSGWVEGLKRIRARH